MQLGGHGTDQVRFGETSWRDWIAPVLDTYQKLQDDGIEDISFCGVSMSAAMLFYLVVTGEIVPMRLTMIDPFIAPRSKLFRFIQILGPIVRHLDWGKGRTGIERQHWINKIPYQALVEVRRFQRLLLKTMRSSPPRIKARLTAFLATDDPLVSSRDISRMQAYVDVDVRYVDSSRHVFTRLAGCRDVTSKDRANQHAVFEYLMFK